MFIKISIFIRVVRYKTGFSSVCSLLEKVNGLIPCRHCLAGGKCEEIPLYPSTLFVNLFFNSRIKYIIGKGVKVEIFGNSTDMYIIQ